MATNTATCESTLAKATEATAKLKVQIDQLWCDSVTASDGVASERLVAVSHAIRRVFHLLDEGQAIG
ncbi:MAG: hypothetical protein ABI949_12870 [Ilumatobacteraceae bacterium]